MKFDIEKGVKKNQIVIQERYGGNNSLKVMENRSDINEDLYFVDNIDVEYCEDDLQLFSIGSCVATPLIAIKNKDYVGECKFICKKEVQKYQIAILKQLNDVKIIVPIENKDDIYDNTFFVEKLNVKDGSEFNICKVIAIKIMNKDII